MRPEGLQHIYGASDRAPTRKQGVGQLADALLARVAYGQVADQTPHHGGHPETPGIEATYMVGERDLPVAWHVDHSTQLPEITQIYVISVPSFGTSPDGAAPGDGDGA